MVLLFGAKNIRISDNAYGNCRDLNIKPLEAIHTTEFHLKSQLYKEKCIKCFSFLVTKNSLACSRKLRNQVSRDA